MKYTLLELVQDILSSMDSDEVDSINDTVESQQVAKVVRTAYFDIINRAQLPEHYDLRQLTATTITTPVVMTVPDDIAEVKWVKYNHATTTSPEINMTLLSYLCLEDFIDRSDRLLSTADDVDSFTLTVGSDSHTVLYHNNSAPCFYTTTDDNQIIFDSIDLAMETSLTAANSKAYCRLIIPWSMTDDFTPDMDESQFALLLHEAKSLAWGELKQSPHPKAEQSARRAWSQLQRSKHRVDTLSDFNNLPNFGRKSYKY